MADRSRQPSCFINSVLINVLVVQHSTSWQESSLCSQCRAPSPLCLPCMCFLAGIQARWAIQGVLLGGGHACLDPCFLLLFLELTFLPRHSSIYACSHTCYGHVKNDSLPDSDTWGHKQAGRLLKLAKNSCISLSTTSSWTTAYQDCLLIRLSVLLEAALIRLRMLRQPALLFGML